MKKIVAIAALILLCSGVRAQIGVAVDNLIERLEDTTKVEQRVNLVDSVADLKLQLMQMQLERITMQSQLDSSNNGTRDMVRQRQMIDSLRGKTEGAPLIVEGDTLFVIYARIGGVSAAERAAEAAERITDAGTKFGQRTDSVHILVVEQISEIMCGTRVLYSVTSGDAIWMNTTREELAGQLATTISDKIAVMREEHSINQLIKRWVYFILVLLAQFLLYKLTVYIYRRLKARIERMATTKLRSVVVRDYEFLTAERQARILVFMLLLARYAFTLLQLIITVPILFSIFPQTETLAIKIFSYIYQPVKAILISVIDYIPNLFIIAIIYLFIRYLVKGLRYMAREIETEKLRITGFYPDWAQPSFNLIKFFLYAFMVAMIYPYLPGSDTDVFKGVSVFVGLIVSLGSTSVIGNIIAGFVITYMRPFKIGDRIQLNDTVGNVLEKTPFVTRVRTPKNEIITIPNSAILSSQTVNYSASAHDYGLIIHSSVTIGYDAPWRVVHALLIAAAKATPGVESTPEPFVFQTELSDFYPVYQINAYIQDADRSAQIYSDLHQNIQDHFNAAGVEIMSPHYRAERDGNKSTIPESPNPPKQ